MSVPEQIPYVGYIANGQSTEFPITFDLHDPEYLVVTLNKEIPVIGTYVIDMNALKVVFATAPKSGDQVELYRETTLNRDIDYKSYDNSFRPETVNYDYDKIWHVLQEQGMINAETLAKIKEEIEWRRTHDANFDELTKMRDAQIFSGLKGYIDTLYAASNPNVFDGVTAGIVFALDKKSVQTHLEIIYEMLENNRIDFEEALESEKNRAIEVEADLLKQIQDEVLRATGVEESLQLQVSTSNAGIKYFSTEAELLATTPGATDPKQAYAFDTKKNYLWTGAIWKDEGLSQLDQAKAFANANPNFKATAINDPFDFDTKLIMGHYDVATSVLNSSTHKPPFDVGGIFIIEGSGKDYFARQRFCTIDNQEAVRTKKDVWGAWDVVIKSGDLKAKPITAPIDFNTYKTPGPYTITTAILIQCTNKPPVTAGGFFEVKGTGADYLTSQEFKSYDNIDASRALTNVWGAWDTFIKSIDIKPKVVAAAIDFNAFNVPGPYSITNNVLATCTNKPSTTFGGIFENKGTGAAYYTHRTYISYKGEFFYQALETTWGSWKKVATTDITDNLAQQIAAIQTPSTGLTGKKWLAVGDSIPNGYQNTNNRSFINILCDRYAANLTKHTFDGAWLSAGTGTIAHNTLSQTFTSLPNSANYDLIIIAAGTNDRIDEVNGKLGGFNDRGVDTFYGSIHVLIPGLKSKYPNARMLFISQIPRTGFRFTPTGATEDIDKKYKAIVEVCDYYGVPVWAGHKNFGFHPDDSTAFKTKYMPDGLHPSDDGQIWYANRLEQFILSNAK